MSCVDFPEFASFANFMGKLTQRKTQLIHFLRGADQNLKQSKAPPWIWSGFQTEIVRK